MRILEIADNVFIFVGLVNEQDIDYSHLNGFPIFEDEWNGYQMDTKHGNYRIFIDDFIEGWEGLNIDI